MRRKHYPEPVAPSCRCGARMIPDGQRNSGTTFVAFRCPVAPAYNPTGHQWMFRTTPEHFATGCCYVEKVVGGAPPPSPTRRTESWQPLSPSF
jgi:hypothetical protein